VESTKISGSYSDPARSRVTVGAWSRQWLDAQSHLKPATRARYANILSKHVAPRWGSVPLAKVSHADVAAWIASIDLAPASLRYIHRVFSLVLQLAVRDGRIPRNPATGVRLPKPQEPEKRFLTKEEVFRPA
jgi:integrase